MTTTDPTPAETERPPQTPLPDSAATSATEGEGRGKRPKKYSRGTKAPQQLGHALSKGAARLSKAVATGFDTFYQRQSKSSRNKRDGMIKDAMKNWNHASRDAAKEAVKAPYDVFKRVDFWRQARAGMRMALGKKT